MTRTEAIDYLKELKDSAGLCYVCGNCGGDNCKLKAVIEYLERDLGDRLIEVLREVRGEE